MSRRRSDAARLEFRVICDFYFFSVFILLVCYCYGMLIFVLNTTDSNKTMTAIDDITKNNDDNENINNAMNRQCYL